MVISQILNIVLGRKALFLAVVCSVVALVAAISLLSPKQYMAELALVIDTKGNDPLADATLAPALVPAYLATQAEIIRSRNVAIKVIEQLKLERDAKMLEKTTGLEHGTDMRQRLVDALLERVEARTSRNSNLIRIAYSSTDAEAAAALANAFADAYIQTSLELHVDPARRQAAWFDQQIEQLRQDLVAAQGRLAQYQSDHGVLGVDDARLDVENARLQELSNQLVGAQAAMYEAETRRASRGGSSPAGELESLPDLQQNPVLQNLKAELSRAEAKLAEIGERFGRNHPQYRSAAAEVTALRTKMAAEVGVVSASLSQSAAMARRKVEQIQKALDEQKDRIIALKREHDQLTVMNRDVESARGAYDEALKHANQTRLESRIEGTNVAILNRASAPLRPASPRVLLNVVVAFFAGLALATGIVMLLELRSRRLRSHDDLLLWADLPLLGELPPLPVSGRARIGRSRKPALLRANTT